LLNKQNFGGAAKTTFICRDDGAPQLGKING